MFVRVYLSVAKQILGQGLFFHFHKTPHGGLWVAVFYMSEGQFMADNGLRD